MATNIFFWFLQEAVQLTLEQANGTLSDIRGTLDNTLRIAANLTEAVRIAGVVRSIQLPSLEYATMLADRIVRNIVSDDRVREIWDDAREALATAEQALELARNARYVNISRFAVIVIV